MKKSSSRAIGSSSFETIWRNRDLHFMAFVVFLVVAFLLGGGSRADIQSLIVLRPLAILCGTYFVWEAWKRRAKPWGLPIWLLLALAACMALQLVPLPYSVWTALPGRDVIERLGSQAGLGEIARPLSLTPGRTLNSLMSLAVPLAAYVGYRNLSSNQRSTTWWILIALGGLTIIFGGLQLLAGGKGIVYPYRISNFGSAVGIFSNRNHNAFFIAIMIVALCVKMLEAHGTTGRKKILWALTASVMLVAFLMILIIGSRTGFVLGMIAGGISLVIVERWRRQSMRPVDKGGREKAMAWLRRFWVMTVVGGLGLAAIATGWSRFAALDRLFVDDNVADLRWRALPYVAKASLEYFPLGSGFGSFENVWRIYEPTSLLQPTYLNQAHNDWIQLLLEGGLAASLIVLLFIVWWAITSAKALRQMWMTKEASAETLGCVRGAAVILLIGLASFTDYPLRVPSLMVLFAVSSYDLVAYRWRRSALNPR